MGRDPRPCGRGVVEHGTRDRLEGAAVLRWGHDAAALLPDDRGQPRDQVAEVVGQVGVVAGDRALVGEVAV